VLVVVVDRFHLQTNPFHSSHPSSTLLLHSATSSARARSSPELSSSERAAVEAGEDEEEEDEALNFIKSPSTSFLLAFFEAPEVRGSMAELRYARGGLPFIHACSGAAIESELSAWRRRKARKARQQDGVFSENLFRST